MSKIIHITGPSGSGKSSMIDKLNKHKNIIILDTDIIDDKHALDLLKNDKYKKYISNGNIYLFFKQKDKLNSQYLKNFIKDNYDKIIIIIGLAFGDSPKNISNYKFCIKIDPETLYKRVYLRTLFDICTHSNEIEKLLKSKIHPEIIKILIVHKFHVRQDFIGPYYPAIDDLNKFYGEHKKNKYEIIDKNMVFKKVIKLIKN